MDCPSLKSACCANLSKDCSMANKSDTSTAEDKDAVEYGEGEADHLDDEYARKIYDMIDGVEEVRKIGDEEYEVVIA